jgi:serine/threonine-protein kinase HipA
MQNSSQKIDNCFVFIHLPNSTESIVAGNLQSIDSLNLEFSYCPEYINMPGTIAVDPINLPLSSMKITMNDGHFGAIRDAAPDLWGQMVLAWHLGKDPAELTLLDMLIHGSHLRIGNLDFRTSISSSAEETYFPQYTTLEELLILAESIQKGNALTKSQLKLMPLMVQGTSIGGARPKCTIEDQGHLWIAKFPDIRDSWSNARVEFATMNLAADCGVAVPRMRLIDVDGKDILLVERFDRKPLACGAYARAGYLSALSILNIVDNDYCHFSYLEIADVLSRYSHEDSHQLFERMVFNILCRNLDDHPRNHGFLICSEGGIRLAPAFDITPTTSTFGLSTTTSQAMTVGDCGHDSSLANALSKVDKFGLCRAEAEAIVSKMLRVQLNNWRSRFVEAGVPENIMKRFENSFETRWADVKLEKLMPTNRHRMR